MSGSDTAGSPGRFDNGLRAARYVALTDVQPSVGEHLLAALGRARIAAYLGDGAYRAEQRRLFVDSDDRVDARTVIASAARALGGAAEFPELAPQRDPHDQADTEAAFHELVADWRIDTIAAVRDAERDLTREDADWRARLANPHSSDEVSLDEEHYVPPPAPPFPRLRRPTVAGIIVVVLSVLMLAFGVTFGLADQVTFTVGCGGLVVGAAILFTRIRDQRRDDDDDGSAI